MDERVARILGKLAEVRARKPRTIGADRHRFKLAKPLTERQVATLEKKHGALPEAYRVFVLQAGASGAGPYYGLLPRKRWDEAGAGYLAIVDQGDDFYAVLGGDGRVKYVAPDGSPPFFPDGDDFLAWYERWLDELTWGYEHFWFGRPMAGSVAELVASLAGPRRGDALWALAQVAELPVEARAAVREHRRRRPQHQRRRARAGAKAQAGRPLPGGDHARARQHRRAGAPRGDPCARPARPRGAAPAARRPVVGRGHPRRARPAR